MTWHQVRNWFAVDGALRDILVVDTCEADWDKLIAAVADWGYETCWSEGQPSPACARDALLAPELPVLGIRVGTVMVNLHFFCVEEIEMDIDPREVQSEIEFARVQEFMERVGRLLTKPVRMTMEGSPEQAFMVFDPITAACNFPTGSRRRTNVFRTPLWFLFNWVVPAAMLLMGLLVLLDELGLLDSTDQAGGRVAYPTPMWVTVPISLGLVLVGALRLRQSWTGSAH